MNFLLLFCLSAIALGNVPRLPLDDPLDEGRSYRSLLEEFSDLRRHREELTAMGIMM